MTEPDDKGGQEALFRRQLRVWRLAAWLTALGAAFCAAGALVSFAEEGFTDSTTQSWWWQLPLAATMTVLAVASLHFLALLRRRGSDDNTTGRY
jgi:membrane protein YdbS with pleckstrin-like domain